ncbi:MAG: hypothetical protein AAB036_03450 [Elusimicrobiota bacterium]
MKRGAVIAAGVLALAALGWRTARHRTSASDSAASSKLRVLEEILRSRNDNDPRLDREFTALSAETKRLFRRAYGDIPTERRNDRGTIVYLLGRNLTAPEDWSFLKKAALEPPCLSLADCSKAAASPDDEVTLAYPSLVALKQAQRFLDEHPGSPEAIAVIAAAKASEVRAVVRLAEKLAPSAGQ